MPNHLNNHLPTPIPSSPPLLPSSSSTTTTTTTNLQLTGQKRFLETDLSSDDIPVFSSDDLPPKEVFENPYHAYRRSARTVKRQRSGTIQSILKHRTEINFLSSDRIDRDYYEDGLPSSSKSKGCDNGDDDGDNHEDDEAGGNENEHEEANTSISTIRPPASEPDLLRIGIPSDAAGTDLSEDPQDIEANLIIQKVIENGFEVVDLSNLSLTHTPTDISSLSSLILQPKDSLPSSSSPSTLQKSTSLLRSSSGIDPTVSSPYTSLHPQIHLHLHHNSLTTLSPSLTSLQTITGLFLRKNLLRSLPHHISNLTVLTNLSLGENLLAYLPFSLLSLQHLTPTAGLSFFPNPFFTFIPQDLHILPKRSVVIQDDDNGGDNDDKNNKQSDLIRLPKSAHTIPSSTPTRPAFIKSTITKHFIYNFITSTPLSAFNELGILVTPPLSSIINHPTQWPHLTKRSLKDTNLPLLPTRQQKPRKKCIENKFPSLQELCLRKIATHTMYASLKQEQREDLYELLPEHLKRKVIDALEEGNGKDAAVKKCTVCKAEYVLKGVEWIEFWDVIPWEDAGKEDVMVEYFKPTVVERLLKEAVEGDDEKKRAMAEMVRGMKWNRFLKRYLGRRGEGRANVVPLVREACSWECGEVWMGQREAAEEEDGDVYW
ncbi:hypothetical protein TWF106_003630 [Orbilia oligospora]|uniref:Uncharacterized protein n=1 Tax=Orbilia oligospora TaxID=2813651 RepID=A0A7C8KSF8_ORBOL|nr:hypothetical protein TWF788_009297 [Orbilia oligospora]KAF3224663.1 hypothetical protein TWF106_003630 [Orbilia oligospora]